MITSVSGASNVVVDDGDSSCCPTSTGRLHFVDITKRRICNFRCCTPAGDFVIVEDGLDLFDFSRTVVVRANRPAVGDCRLTTVFDAVDHESLLGVRTGTAAGSDDLALDWYRSYLSDRARTFHVEADISSTFSWIVGCRTDSSWFLRTQRKSFVAPSKSRLSPSAYKT